MFQGIKKLFTTTDDTANEPKTAQVAEDASSVENEVSTIETEFDVQQDIEEARNEEASLASLVSNPMVVGYSTIEEQQICFGILLAIGYHPEADSILDVGCGLADLSSYIEALYGVAPSNYFGIDTNPNIIQLANYKYGDAIANRVFTFPSWELGTEVHPEELPSEFDWVVASGIFNYNISTESENPESIQIESAIRTIRTMYAMCKRGVAVNFLSDRTGEQYPEQLFAYNAGKVLDELVKEFGNVILRHDYIRNDFTVYIYKSR